MKSSSKINAYVCHKRVEREDKSIPVHKPMILNSCTQILMNSLTQNNNTCTYHRTLEFTVRIHKDDTRIPCIHISTVTANKYKLLIPTDIRYAGMLSKKMFLKMCLVISLMSLYYRFQFPIFT